MLVSADYVIGGTEKELWRKLETVNVEVRKLSPRITMSSKCLLTSAARQFGRASCKQSLRHASSTSSSQSRQQAARLSLSSQTCLRRLSNTPTLRLQEARPSVTNVNTSSQEPNKAASAGATGATAGAAEPTQSKIYSYQDILAHTSSPDPNRILIDVREPSELQATGYIPTAINIPITSSPDAFFLPETEFEDRFGFRRPGPDAEVVFYCKSGVRSKAAARMARQAEPRFGGRVGEFPGSWKEWEANGGAVARN